MLHDVSDVGPSIYISMGPTQENYAFQQALLRAIKTISRQTPALGARIPRVSPQPRRWQRRWSQRSCLKIHLLRMFYICKVLIQLTAALAVHVHKLVEVEAGPLHHLHLPDVHIVEGVDA